MLSQWISLLMTAGVAVMLQTSTAQEVGVDICACQPSVYEITLDFDLVCEDTDVMGPGINDTACLISSRLPDTVNVTDLVPVQVNQIQILELDQNQEVLGQTIYEDGPYFNGDKIFYTSIVRRQAEIIDGVTIPRGIQASISGNNALNQPLLNTWGILYDNDCGVFPLLEVGEKIGWSVFTDLGDPPLQFCPLAPPTLFPTSAPTVTPNTTATPTAFPTETPTVSPTEAPGDVTDSPTVSPTEGEDTPFPTVSPPTPDPAAPTCPPAGNPKVSGSKGNKGTGKPAAKGAPKKKSKKDYYGKMEKLSSAKSSSKGSKSGGMDKLSMESAKSGGKGGMVGSGSSDDMSGKGGKGSTRLLATGGGSKGSKSKGSGKSRRLGTGAKPEESPDESMDQDECPEPN